MQKTPKTLALKKTNKLESEARLHLKTVANNFNYTSTFLLAERLHFLLLGNDSGQASAREFLPKTQVFSFSRKKARKE
jgi:hypothetical protein